MQLLHMKLIVCTIIDNYALPHLSRLTYNYRNMINKQIEKEAGTDSHPHDVAICHEGAC